MSANSRLTIAAHTLTWIGLYQRRGQEVATSAQIAGSVNTNPVVIRRLLGELRNAGLAESRRGSRAGWTLTRDLAAITLLDVYQAIEPGPVFGLHPAMPNQACPVGSTIGPVLTAVYGRAEAALGAELAKTTLEDVLQEILKAA